MGHKLQDHIAEHGQLGISRQISRLEATVSDYLLITNIDDTPVDSETAQPISSNWAFDHEAAADPHGGYRLESTDHSHQSTGAQAGKIDHGAALDGLDDDDHTIYSLVDGTRVFTGAVSINRDSSDTNLVRVGLSVKHATDDDMVDDFGAGIQFLVEDDISSEQILAQIDAVRVNDVDNSGRLQFSTYSAGSFNRCGFFDHNGSFIVTQGVDPAFLLGTEIEAVNSKASNVTILSRNLSTADGAVATMSLNVSKTSDPFAIVGELVVYSEASTGTWGGESLAEAMTLADFAGFPISKLMIGTRSGAPIHFLTNSAVAMTVDSSGEVGIGTDAPKAKLHVVRDISTGLTPDVAADELYIDGTGHTGMTIASGPTMQGGIYFQDGSGTAGYEGFISYDHNSDEMWFATSHDIKMTIDSGGDVGIGVAPSRRLDVQTDHASNVVASFFNDGNNANRYGIKVRCGLDDGLVGDNYYFFATDGGDGDVGYLRNINGIFQLTQESDERRKSSIAPTQVNALDIINQIPLKEFYYNNRKTGEPSGPLHLIDFVAQDVETVIPAMTGDGPGGFKVLAPTAIIPYLTKAIQEQQVLIEQLTARIETLEKE